MEYNDRSHKYFFNAASYAMASDRKCREFLEFLHTNTPISDMTQKMESAVNDAKKNARWRQEYMFFNDILIAEKETAMEIGHAEGHAQGHAQGKLEGARENAEKSAINLLKMRLGTQAQIAQATGLTLNRVQELSASLFK